MLTCPSHARRRRPDHAHVLRRPDRPRSGGRHHRDAAAAHRRRCTLTLRPAQPPHLFGGADQEPSARYRRYTATIGVLTLDNTLLTRAVVQNEFRTAADLVDRVSGGNGPGGVKAVAPTGTESVSVTIPAAENSGQHSRREALGGPRRRHRQLQRVRPADGHHQQRHGGVPPGPAPSARRRPDAGEQPTANCSPSSSRSTTKFAPCAPSSIACSSIDLPVAARDPGRRRRLDRRHPRGARRCAARSLGRDGHRGATQRRQGQRDPARTGPRHAARSSPSRTPTSSSIRSSCRRWSSRSSVARRTSSSVRASSTAATAAPWITVAANRVLTSADQRALRRGP